MPDPINTPTIEASAELTTLKNAHQELLTKRAKDKAKIAELETASATLQDKLTLAEKQVYEAIVGQPLKQLAQSISTVPNVWLETFAKHFDVSSKDGALVISDKAGKAIKHQNGEALKFNQSEIAKYLTENEPDSERTKLFKMITIGSRASGASSNNSVKPNQPSNQARKFHFGIH